MTLCDADQQCSDICIIDGAFAWQTVGEHHISSSESGADSPAAETSANVSRVDHSSDEDAVLVHEVVPSDDALLTLTNINFTVPKVYLILRFF